MLDDNVEVDDEECDLLDVLHFDLFELALELIDYCLLVLELVKEISSLESGRWYVNNLVRLILSPAAAQTGVCAALNRRPPLN